MADPRFFPALGNDLMGRKPNLYDWLNSWWTQQPQVQAPPPPTSPPSPLDDLGFLEALQGDLLGQSPNLRNYFGMAPAQPTAPRAPEPGMMEALGKFPGQLVDFGTNLNAGVENLATRDQADADKLELQVLGEQVLGNTLKLPQTAIGLADRYIRQPWENAAGTYAGAMLGAESGLEGLASDTVDYLGSTVGENEERAQQRTELGQLHAAGDHVNLEGLAPEASSAMLQLQQAWGKPLNIISGYRDPDYNKKVGGAKSSQHIHGNAVDVDTTGMSAEEKNQLAETASALGFTGIGFYENSMHFDVRPTGKATWGPDYSSASVPGWAKPAAAAHQSGKYTIDLGKIQQPGQIPAPPNVPMPGYIPRPGVPELPAPPGIEVPDVAGVFKQAGIQPPAAPDYDLIRNRPALTPPSTVDPQVYEDYLGALEQTRPDEPDQERQSERQFLMALGGLAAGAAAGGDDVGSIIASMGAGGIGSLVEAMEMELAEDEEYQNALRQHQLAMAQAQLATEEAMVRNENLGIDFANNETLRQYEGALGAEEARLSHDASMGQYRAQIFDMLLSAEAARTDAINRTADRLWSHATEGMKLRWENKLLERGDLMTYGESVRQTQATNAEARYRRDLAQYEQDIAQLPQVKVAGNNITVTRTTGGQMTMDVVPLRGAGGVSDKLKQMDDLMGVLPEDHSAQGALGDMVAMAMAAELGSPQMALAVAASDMLKRLPTLSPEAYEAISDQVQNDARAAQKLPGTEEGDKWIQEQMLFYMIESLAENPDELAAAAEFSPAARAYIEMMTGTGARVVPAEQ